MDNSRNVLQSEGNLLFVGGDLSGIQKFIYDIPSKRAALSLKGRSAYLTNYTKEICNNITHLKGVTNPKEVYCSSGKFYLIIDDTEEGRKALEDFRKAEVVNVWNKHKGQLGLNISYTSFSFNEDGTVNAGGETSAKIGLLWKILTEEFMRLKAQKFKDVMLENYEQFFEVSNVGGGAKVCAITGIEDNNCVKISDSSDAQPIYVLKSVKEQIELGQEIRNKEHFKTFDEYAKDSYLGVLRMDVDGLGKRFIEGFKDLEEYTEFSTKLKVFFDKEIKKIQQKIDFKDDLNIIYAGGDDIFAVGLWNQVIAFANEVRIEFAKYIDNEDITISGGIAIVHPHFPIAKAAEISGEAEDMAKDFCIKVNGKEIKKNAFCMFGTAISWKYEFDYVEQFKQRFYDLISYNGMSRGILHKIMTYSQISADNEKKKAKGKEENYSYRWHATYYLTRLMSKTENPQVKSFIQDLRDHQLSGFTRNFTLIALAARWAELELRNSNK